MENQAKYESLSQTPPEELIEAAIRHYEKSNPEAREFMQLGFKIAQTDGWRQVAPQWVADLNPMINGPLINEPLWEHKDYKPENDQVKVRCDYISGGGNVIRYIDDTGKQYWKWTATGKIYAQKPEFDENGDMTTETHLSELKVKLDVLA